MEFDLETFMSEVTNALEFGPPLSPDPKSLHERQGDKDGATSDLDCFITSERDHVLPPSKRRRVSSTSQSTAEITPGNGHSPGIPSFFHPSLDMTTAIESCNPRPLSSIPAEHGELQRNDPMSAALKQTENLDLVPEFYSYSVKSCLMPIRRVQDQLVAHYFFHVHPMFPLVDEVQFTRLHKKYKGREELMNKDDFMVYYAIMVAGFAHLSEAQVERTPYRSVTDGQEAQVEQLKARYWSRQTEDPVVLTQICLILSLWSPGWIGIHNNSYWLDMAFKHAIDARLWDTPALEPSQQSRRKVLWWCCLIRDRVLALGMRRPHRLHKTPMEGAIITEKDFGHEAIFPCYSSLKSKQIEMLAFIWFCKISRIMEELALMQRRHRFARDWNGDNSEDLATELEEVNQLHIDLESWLKEFEDAMSEATGDEEDQKVSIPVSTLRILAHSLHATLYQPYLHIAEDHPSLIAAGLDPLKQIKKSAREVAKSATDVMANKQSDVIPTWLVSWITLPVAVYHVNQRIRLNATPDQVLMPFLAQLVRRTSGALMLLLTVRNATKDHIEKITNLEDDSSSATLSGPSGFTFVHSGLSQPAIPRSREAKLLAFVTKTIDSALEANGSNQEVGLLTAQRRTRSNLRMDLPIDEYSSTGVYSPSPLCSLFGNSLPVGE